MSRQDISQALEGVSAIRGLFITAMPDCLLFDSWMREESTWVAEDVASYFGDLVRANREGLKALGSWSAEMQVTIESADSLIILRELESDFVIAFVFDRETPLGMVRLQVKQVLERIQSLLPAIEVEERPEGVRVVEFLQRYAPDPHASLMRVALQTGIEMDALRHPESLTVEQVEAVKESAQDILGLEHLHI
jgi:predicted regulator of Ras-like GTPase activity (Roadblock/LC7/MglB family)